jgi:hypothetical protein
MRWIKLPRGVNLNHYTLTKSIKSHRTNSLSRCVEQFQARLQPFFMRDRFVTRHERLLLISTLQIYGGTVATAVPPTLAHSLRRPALRAPSVRKRR